jgi:hypothetical protein
MSIVKVVEHDDADGIAVGVEHVVVADPVLAGNGHNDGIHPINLS